MKTEFLAATVADVVAVALLHNLPTGSPPASLCDPPLALLAAETALVWPPPFHVGTRDPPACYQMG